MKQRCLSAIINFLPLLQNSKKKNLNIAVTWVRKMYLLKRTKVERLFYLPKAVLLSLNQYLQGIPSSIHGGSVPGSWKRGTLSPWPLILFRCFIRSKELFPFTVCYKRATSGTCRNPKCLKSLSLGIAILQPLWIHKPLGPEHHNCTRGGTGLCRTEWAIGSHLICCQSV